MLNKINKKYRWVAFIAANVVFSVVVAFGLSLTQNSDLHPEGYGSSSVPATSDLRPSSILPSSVVETPEHSCDN